MKKQIFTLGLMLTLSAPVLAQRAADIKNLTKTKENMIKTIERSESFLNEDRSATFACYNDFEAPFMTLQASALQKLSQARENVETTFDTIIDGVGENGLEALVIEIEARKAQIKKEKNKRRKKELKELLKSKIGQAREMAILVKQGLTPSLNESIKNIVTLDGSIQFAMDERAKELQVTTIFKEKVPVVHANGMSPAENYNRELVELLNQCSTKDCVHLLSAEVKNIIERNLKLNQNVKIIKGVKVKKSKVYGKRKMFKKLDEIIADVAKRKPIAALDPSCLPSEPTPVPPTNDDEPTGDDDVIVGDDGGVIVDDPTYSDDDFGSDDDLGTSDDDDTDSGVMDF